MTIRPSEPPVRIGLQTIDLGGDGEISPSDTGAAAGAAAGDAYIEAPVVFGSGTVVKGSRTSVKDLTIRSSPAEIRTVAEKLAELIMSPQLTTNPKDAVERGRVAGEIYSQLTMLFQLGDGVKGAMIEEMGRLVGSPAALQMRLDLADELSHAGKPVFSWVIAVNAEGHAMDISVEEAAASGIQTTSVGAGGVAGVSNGKRIGNPGKPRRKSEVKTKKPKTTEPQKAVAQHAKTFVERLKRNFQEQKDLIDLLGRVEAFNKLLAESFDQVETVFRRNFGGDLQKKETAEHFLRRIIRDGIGGRSGLYRRDLPRVLALALAAPLAEEAEKRALVVEVGRIMTIGVTEMLKPELDDRVRALLSLVTEINNLPADQRAVRIPDLLSYLPAVKVSDALGSISRMLEASLVKYVFGEPLPPEQVAEGPVNAKTVSSAPSIGQEDEAAAKRIIDNLITIRPIVGYIGKLNGPNVLVLSAEAIARWESSPTSGFRSFISARRTIYLELELVRSLSTERQDNIIRTIRHQMNLNTEQLRLLFRKLNLLVRGSDTSFTIVMEGREYGFKKLGPAWSFADGGGKAGFAALAASPKGMRDTLADRLRANFPVQMAKLSYAELQKLAKECATDFWKLSPAEQATFGSAKLGEIPLTYLRARVAALHGATAEGVDGEAARRERDSDAEKERGREGRGRSEEGADQTEPVRGK